MPANIPVIEKSDRASRLKQAPALEGRSLPIRFKAHAELLPIKRIPIDLPIYRMLNIRTIVRQRRAVAEKGLADNFFRDGQENPIAQREQHALLVKLSQDPRKNIYEALRTDPHQMDPLIVTTSAVVLNGNRRLAAMRELYSEDPVKYGPFAYAEVAVLPEATEGELAELETDLQIAPDLKLDYGWVETGLGLRMQLEELGWDITRAAQHWRKDPKELREILGQLRLAEEFLEYEGHPLEYHRVADDELAFERLQQKLGSRKGAAPSRLEAERLIVFAVIANQAAVGGRVYNYAGSVDKLTERFLKSELVPAPAPARDREGDDPLGDLPDGDASVPSSALEYLRSVANGATVARFAEDAYEEFRDTERREVRGNRFLSDAKRINALASGLSLEDTEVKTITSAATQLFAALDAIARHLDVVAKSHPQEMAKTDRGLLERARKQLDEFAQRIAKAQ